MKTAVKLCLSVSAFLIALTVTSHAAVQYQNDFNDPSSEIVGEAYPEWVDFGGNTVRAVNGRLEWGNSGGNDDWIRLDLNLPFEYTFEFDFFTQAGTNGRFSVWPAAKPGESIFDRHNYFIRANTHYFNGADTIPSEGPRDLTLPTGSDPHRLRFEVSGDHVAFLYKDRGQGGWILVDERDFPPFEEGERYIQLGHNHDSGPGGVHWIDNIVVNFSDEDLFRYTNNFNDAPSQIPGENWPEWVDFGGNAINAVNGRMEWGNSGGNDDWIRLDHEVPENFVMEFDFFTQAGVNGRFSVWPLVNPGESIFDRHNYFIRANTHYFNGADTIPSEGPRDLTLPPGSDPHRLRFEVTGDHVAFLYKDRGEGGWILIDERDFPPFGDGPRYVQLGFNHDSGPGGVHWIDNFSIVQLASDRAIVERALASLTFEADTPLLVTLGMTVTGTLPSITLTESFPPNWTVQNISHGGVVSGNNIIWSFTNLSESQTLTYEAVPPRLVRARTADFAGSVDSGDGEERITGDTLAEIVLPIFYREAIDYDFSGSPVGGRNYPVDYALGERYTEGLDGIPSDVVYARPGNPPQIGDSFTFPSGADFRHGNPTSLGQGEAYIWPDYRDEGEIVLQRAANESNAAIGALSAGDWFRYTFDFGEEPAVLIVSFEVNTWGQGDCELDVYVDGSFVGSILAPGTPNNEFNFFSVGPFEVPAGEHSIVIAVPGAPNTPDDLGQIQVTRIDGIGRVERTLTAEGSFEPGQPLNVTLDAQAQFGSYAPYIEESIPVGSDVQNISGGGSVVGDKIIWQLEPTSGSTQLTYTVLPPEGVRFVLFDGIADVGLPLADTVKGDTSVFNQVWLFGESSVDSTDSFDSALGAPWFIEYGSDPALDTDYQEGASIGADGGLLNFAADAFGEGGRFDEWANGRRAPMVLRTDVPDGDWRIETDLTVNDALEWDEFHIGLAVSYNQGDDDNVTGDEYLTGFHSDEIRAELTNVGQMGALRYHEFSDVIDWYDMLDAGDINAKLAVTRRGDELVFSAQLPGRPWQLLGAPTTETRQATRVGLFAKIWAAENYVEGSFDYFTLSELEPFTSVVDWSLY